MKLVDVAPIEKILYNCLIYPRRKVGLIIIFPLYSTRSYHLHYTDNYLSHRERARLSFSTDGVSDKRPTESAAFALTQEGWDIPAKFITHVILQNIIQSPYL